MEEQHDPGYTVPIDYGALTGFTTSYPHQYGRSQMLPDTQTTYGTSKLNGYYLKKSMSSGEHAEEDVIRQVKNLCDQEHTCLMEREINKLSIHLNKSPCTSVSRDGYPATRTNGDGCTERLIALAKYGYKGYRFYIRLKVQNLYQPREMGKGVKKASILAIQELEKNGIPVIGYNREAKLERAKNNEMSHRGEPLSPYDVTQESVPFEYTTKQKEQLGKQWQSVSETSGKKGVYQWRHNK
jgi:hypothetical protein